MKLNIPFTLIAVAVAALLGWMVYAISTPDDHAAIAAFGSGISFAVTLIPAIGMTYETCGTAVNLRVLSFGAFFAILIAQLIFAFTHIALPAYPIVSALLVLIYIALAYAIARAKQ
ncbi:MAG: hypothetical protein J1F25_01170 [Prevotellaceae bacterium]|nr:hypothetical protein [Prevotellaceae bacterium]